MRKLDFKQFGEKKGRMFSILWLAYRATYPKQAVGYEQMKLCNRIGAMLEAMSDETPTPNDAMERKLKDAKPVLLMSAMEYEKLQTMLKSSEIGWTHVVGPDVEHLIEAMDAAPEVEVEEKAEKPKLKKVK